MLAAHSYTVSSWESARRERRERGFPTFKASLGRLSWFDFLQSCASSSKDYPRQRATARRQEDLGNLTAVLS